MAQLSHEEIWDDSYLVQSWDDAVAEYKKYHSIAAKGENVEELIKQLQDEETARSNSFADANGARANAAQLSNEAEDKYVPSASSASAMDLEKPIVTSKNAIGHAADTETSTVTRIDQGTTDSNASAHATPQALLATVQDDNMKNLVMSWYYAGYYTGLQEGHQKAVAEMATPKR